jgi:uncharacterized membrane protein YphA (DoxX/SURF4 family)
MDSEGDPFESSEERAYNLALQELAKKKTECSSLLEELHQKATRLAQHLDGGTVSTGIIDAQPGFNSTPHVGSGDGGNQTMPAPGVSLNETVLDPGGSFNATLQCPVCPECPPVKDCSPVQDCPPRRDCPPVRDCERSLEGVNSSRPLPPSDEGSGSGLVALPESFLVGAAVTLLVVVLVVLIGVVIRYIPIVLSGALVLCLLCIVWYYSSKYPEASRRLGSRIWSALRGAAAYLVDRLLGRRNSEVSGKAVELDNSCIGVIV